MSSSLPGVQLQCLKVLAQFFSHDETVFDVGIIVYTGIDLINSSRLDVGEKTRAVVREGDGEMVRFKVARQY